MPMVSDATSADSHQLCFGSPPANTSPWSWISNAR